MNKPIVYIDMDRTAVDFDKQYELYKSKYPKHQYPQSNIGFFSTIEPMLGFKEAWNILIQHYDLRFLTRPSLANLNSYTEKAIWVRDNVGEKHLENLNLCPKKEIVGEIGDYLIDDGILHGQLNFKGTFIQFGKEGIGLNWFNITEFLLSKVENNA